MIHRLNSGRENITSFISEVVRVPVMVPAIQDKEAEDKLCKILLNLIIIKKDRSQEEIAVLRKRESFQAPMKEDSIEVPLTVEANSKGSASQRS